MALKGDLSEKPLVLLEARELLGMRQIAKVSTRRTEEALCRVETSRMLNKIGEVESRAAAVSRAELSRSLSKIGAGEVGETGAPPCQAAVSRADMSSLLSKIGSEVD